MYSDVSAIAFGIAPPMPSPVNTRNVISASTDCAVAVSSEPTPKISADADQHRLPANAVGKGTTHQRATIIPTSPLEITESENASRYVQCRGQRRRDIPIAWASNPSTNTMSAHMPATRAGSGRPGAGR